MPHPLTFLRGRFRRSIFWLVIAVGWPAAAGMALLAPAALLEPGAWAGRVMNAVMALGCALGLIPGMLAMQRWNRAFARNFLTIDEAGVRGRWGTSEVQLSWAEIHGVAHVRRGMDVFILRTDSGRLPFTVLDIPKPKAAARAIASRIGVPVHEIAAR